MFEKIKSIFNSKEKKIENLIFLLIILIITLLAMNSILKEEKKEDKNSNLEGAELAMADDVSSSLEKRIERPKEDKKLIVDFNATKKSSEVVLNVEGLTVFKDNGDKILDNVSLKLLSREKVAFIGDNGSGKSTFIKSVLGESDLSKEGLIYLGPSVNIGYLPQVIDFKDDKLKVLDYFKNTAYLDEQNSRAILASFHFYKDDVNKFVKNLSGGERVRLKLAILLQSKVNCLIFDEPTNHIDISTKEVLEEAIEKFKGTFIFVSHDRYFINKFADKIIEFKNGKITSYNGNYDCYKEVKK